VFAGTLQTPRAPPRRGLQPDIPVSGQPGEPVEGWLPGDGHGPWHIPCRG
jgi:hypothetical protein